MDCSIDSSTCSDECAASPLHRRLRILVIDHDVECAVSTRLMCKLWGYEAKQCRSGEDAIKKLASYSRDVFLLDTALPRMSGFDLAVELRELPCYSGALLIAVSDQAGDAYRTRALVAGFDYYLTKPASSEILKQLLHEEECHLCDLIAWGVVLVYRIGLAPWRCSG